MKNFKFRHVIAIILVTGVAYLISKLLQRDRVFTTACDLKGKKLEKQGRKLFKGYQGKFDKVVGNLSKDISSSIFDLSDEELKAEVEKEQKLRDLEEASKAALQAVVGIAVPAPTDSTTDWDAYFDHKDRLQAEYDASVEAIKAYTAELEAE